jgi:hypothetical protein
VVSNQIYDMEKEELKKHLSFLKRTLDDFKKKEQHFLHGNTSKIRKRALTYLEIYLKRFEKYVTENNELYKLLTSNNGADDAIEISWDELNSIQYFSRVMPIALKKVEGILSEME